MSSVTFGGLVSGLDTNAIIDKLVAIEKQPITTYQKHQSDDNTKLSTLASLVSKVQALSDASNALATSTKANPVGATSSDSSRVAATASTAATSGSYALIVDHLATAQANTSSRFVESKAPGDGSLTITVGSGDPFTVSYEQDDKLEDVAASINGKAAGVVASVVNDGTRYRLVIASTKTGVTNGFTVDESGASLGFEDPGSQTTPPLDAAFSLNGIDITRSTNHVTDVITGVTLDLRSATPVGGAATSITVGLDQSVLTTRIQTLVSTYNDVAKVLNSELSFSGVKRGNDTLFGDGALRDLQRTIASAFGGGYGVSSLSALQFGIELQKDGTMTFDSSKLGTALAANPTGAQVLFAGDNTAGLAQKLKTSLDVFIRPVDGRLVAKQDALKKDITNYDNLITQTNEAAAKMEARLRKQYAAMEQALSNLQTQSGVISTLILGGTSTSTNSTAKASTGSSSRS